MKKLFFLFLLPLFLFSNETKIYNVGVLSDWKPYYSLDKNGKPMGYAIDLFEEIAKNTNIKYKYIIVDNWKELNNQISENNIDLVPNYGITKKRADLLVFSQPTDTFYISLYKRKTSKNINSLDDIVSEKIGVTITNACNSLLDNNTYNQKIVFSEYEDMINSLKLGKIDALCYPKTILDSVLEDFKYGESLEVFGKPVKEIKRGIGISKENFDLLPKIDEAITDLKIDNKFNEIYFKWFGVDKGISLREDEIINIIIGLIIIFIIYIIFILWNRRLKIEYEKQKILRTQLESNKVELQQALLVFENTNDGIIITDKDCNIINVNNSFTQTTGYTKEEAIGKNPNVLRSDLNDDKFYEKMWKSIEKQGFWRGEIVNKHKSGKDYYEILTINALYNSQKNITGYIGIFSDISKQKDDEKLILQQSKVAAIGEMLGNISHQWRQPLSVISTHATGLKLAYEFDEEVTNEKVITTMDEINSQTQYLSKTIDDFRNFFKSDTSSKSEFSIRKSFDSIYNLTKDSFKSQFIIYTIKMDDIVIYGNENIFIQAIINIYNNAKDALSENAKDSEFRYFDVNIYEENENLIIELKDNAGGMPENILTKVFEPYFTTKHKSVGTGIGLYMTNQIITKQFFGTISVSNSSFEKDGKSFNGALFKITIPMSQIP